MLKYLVLAGALAQLTGAYIYGRATVKGEIKPNRVTWLMWSIAPLIASAAELSSGVTWAVLPVFMSGFGPLLVFLVSFVNKDSYWKLTLFDYMCGVFSLVALILWAITKNPSIAVIFAIASDASAALPTLIKAWRYPETESVSVYTTGILSQATGFAALKIFDFIGLGFPIYIILMNSTIIFSVYRKRIFRKKI